MVVADFSAVLISFRFRRTGLELSFYPGVFSEPVVGSVPLVHFRYCFGFPQLPGTFSVVPSGLSFCFGFRLACYWRYNTIYVEEWKKYFSGYAETA